MFRSRNPLWISELQLSEQRQHWLHMINTFNFLILSHFLSLFTITKVCDNEFLVGASLMLSPTMLLSMHMVEQVNGVGPWILWMTCCVQLCVFSVFFFLILAGLIWCQQLLSCLWFLKWCMGRNECNITYHSHSLCSFSWRGKGWGREGEGEKALYWFVYDSWVFRLSFCCPFKAFMLFWVTYVF